MGIKPSISGVTVSVEFGFEGDYGKGTKAFTSLQARYPEAGAPIEEIDDVVDQGLDLYFAAWKTLLASRYASGILAPADFKTMLDATTKRIELVRRHLRKPINE